MARTILVTGGGRGLGAAISRTLGTQGFNVIINYNQSEAAAKALAEEIGNERAVAIQADVTKREDVERLVQEGTKAFGQIDGVVNNALIGFKFDPTAQKAFKDMDWEDYQTQIDGTLKAAFNVVQSVIPQFLSLIHI